MKIFEIATLTIQLQLLKSAINEKRLLFLSGTHLLKNDLKI